MPLYSIPRRSFRPEISEPPVPINWRRGVYRVWLLVSAGWFMSWSIYLIMYAVREGLTTRDLLVVPVLLLGPPVALLIFGLGVGWAFRGFKPDKAPTGD